MKNLQLIMMAGVMALLLVFTQCEEDGLVPYDDFVSDLELSGGDVYESDDATAGNNLSFPVIWADGYEKALREPPIEGEAVLDGEWWYVWDDDPVDPNDDIYSCEPGTEDESLCQDGSVPGDGISNKAYFQKDEFNVWQAANFPALEPVNVDLIDWGDNLESVDWYTNSQVRAEVVLYENLPEPVLEYTMRHVSGWGITEVHGLQTTMSGDIIYGPGNMATVYSHNARMTIQKLNVDREALVPGSLEWIPREGWKEVDPQEDIINSPLFNMAVYEAGDGPGYYNAEINVKGKVIYGYTWNVRKLNEGPADYRITFSFDESGGIVGLNTFFDAFTEIIMPEEEEVENERLLVWTMEAGEGDGGGEAIIDTENNLTYMDIRISEKTKGNGGGNGGGGQGGGQGGQGGQGGGGHDDGGH